MPAATSSILGLDVGNQRIGVALASVEARLAQPLTTLRRDQDFLKTLKSIIEAENVGVLVVGWPRGLAGQSTAQTVQVENFVKELKSELTLPVHLQDEALTSNQAEAELQARGKAYDKTEIDALAATYILTDWLAEAKELD